MPDHGDPREPPGEPGRHVGLGPVGVQEVHAVRAHEAHEPRHGAEHPVHAAQRRECERQRRHTVGGERRRECAAFRSGEER